MNTGGSLPVNWRAVWREPGLRLLLVIGPALFLAVGLWQLAAGRPLLAFPGELAGMLILLIESAATLSIAAALAFAFLGGYPAGWHGTTTGAHEEGRS